MQFDGIFDINRLFRKIVLNTEKHDSISFIDSPQFYIKPIFIDISRKDDAKFLLFSAPGATGKSALAKYIAGQFNALYWDLSKIRLGENSLHGTLIRSMGTKGFADFATSFSAGEILFVIDAFDEADMISGRVALEHLLNDLIELANSSMSCNIVMLARTETAKFIKQHLSSHNASTSHYEIGFFGESQRLQFVRDKIAFSGETITPAITLCIDQFFIHIARVLGDSETVKSFLGYAPVLEAIAKSIEVEKNHAKILSKFNSSDGMVLTSTSIINTILNDLIEREREKVIHGLTERCSARYPEFTKWEELYTEQEQLTRITCYILFGESSYDDFPIDVLPDSIKDDYTKVINTFIKDHPFLLSRTERDSILVDFAGPAFRDFTLSRAIQASEYEFLVDEYFNINKSFAHSRFPSQLFFDFYVIFSEYNIASHHFPYIYDSFKSKELATDKTYITLLSDDKEGEIDFSIFKPKQETYSIQAHLKISDKGLYISQLSNAFIATSREIFIGTRDEVTRITNSTIDAKKIIWNSDNIRIEAFSPDRCSIQSKQKPESKGVAAPSFEVCTDRTENVQICFPDFSHYYKLRPYKFEIDVETKSVDIERFSNALKAVLIFFRKHGKDAPGKHKDLINNIVIGHSKIKKSVFNFLLHKNVIYIDPKEINLYKMSTEEIAKLEINWMLLTQGSTVGLEKAYKEFVSFTRE